MIQAAAEKLVGVIGHWLPFLFPPSQHHRQRRLVFYDDDDVDDYDYEGNNYKNKEMWVICPFNDCSVSLLNDGSEIVINAECPSCHRLFCAHCNVPWHSGLNCQQFQHKLKYSEYDIIDSRLNHAPKKRKFLFDDKQDYDDKKKKKAANCSTNCSFESFCLELKVEEEDLQASIIECQKTTFCPFKNCSVLLVNDRDVGVTSAECPSCHRLFCAQCKVPWHGGINCQEFQQQKLKCFMYNVPNYDERKKKGKAAATAIETETGSPQSPKKSFCGICYDFIPEKDIVRGSGTCNHPFCANCISNHVAKQLSQSIMEFNCPNPRCFEELKPQHLHLILPEEVIVRWESERL
jgi:hypothetical protein